MSSDPSGRRILPQSSQMGTFSFAPQQFQQRETQKNYVFVDEHNRHKRLKVMRACEGCRRRKIKCDAATTNTWPCSACIRLKLHCVRPNGQYDGTSTDSTAYDSQGSDFADPGQFQDSFRQQLPMQQQSMITNVPKPGPSMYATQASYSDDPNVYQGVHYSESPTSQHNMHYTTVAPPPVSMLDQPYGGQGVFHTPPMHHSSRPESPPEPYSPDGSYQQQDLADLLGSLKVNEAGTAPYLRNKASFIKNEEEPAIEDADDYKSALPPLVSGPGLKIRIPPELMPDDETVLHYFDLYFSHVHPYIPVISKTLLYQQWNTNRESISPLILEAIFAIAGRLADEPAQGQQWLALASKHADSFMDVPRLSTLQALLIVLKAREAAPKRGYYYRSWMTVVQCVQMGKDLGLDDHYADHQAGRTCGSNPLECQLKNRIWQSIFVCEVMVGSPQGRTDLAVELDSVDFSVPRPIPGGDDAEYHVARNFTYLARIVRNVSRMNTIYGRIKKKKEWGVDPEFVQLNPALNSWLSDLPADLSVTFPPDGSAPWLSSPFIGNLHSYYYLTLIILHRPQLAFMGPGGVDGQWKQHMMICYSSAKALCRLQESVLNSYGLTGLQCMQRGFSFTVYCGLSCIVLHLVAITSPDPDLNTDAREYFARHMRVLEKVMAVWPMADLQKQINAVREAFSADTRKPFVLKPSFPYGSPQSSNHSTPPRGFQPSMARGRPMDQHLDTQNIHQHSQVSYTSHPITPPISAGPVDSKSDSPNLQSLVMMASSQGPSPPGMAQTMPLPDQPSWNPARIFEQWNTSFGTPQVQSQQATVSPQTASLSPPSGAPEVPTLQDIQAVNSALPANAPQMPPQYPAPPVQQTFVTPAMWQESVASVYEGGLKRAWDYDGSGPMMKRR